MEIPTRRVIHKEHGQECTINASDFDPSVHEEIGKPERKPKAAKEADEKLAATDVTVPPVTPPAPAATGKPIKAPKTPKAPKAK